MKRALFALAMLFALAVVALVIAAPPAVDVTQRPPELPDDLEGYLTESEARFADLRPNVEKAIIWADSSKQKTPVAVVYLHGFSATRHETRPLSDSIAARLGANLFYTRLAGHGRSDDALAEASAAAWIRDGYEALELGRRLGDRVLLIGTSTGGTLATWLAAQPDVEGLLALVLISPNYHPKDSDARFLLWPGGRHLVRLFSGAYRSWTPHNAEQAAYWTYRYPSTVLVDMMQLVDLVEHTDLHAVDTPTLVIYSPNDQVIDARRVEARFPEYGTPTKKLVAVEATGDPSNHVLAGAILSPGETAPLTDTVLTFVRPLLGDR